MYLFMFLGQAVKICIKVGESRPQWNTVLKILSPTFPVVCPREQDSRLAGNIWGPNDTTNDTSPFRHFPHLFIQDRTSQVAVRSESGRIRHPILDPPIFQKNVFFGVGKHNIQCNARTL